jgi:hypothetical protein
MKCCQKTATFCDFLSGDSVNRRFPHPTLKRWWQMTLECFSAFSSRGQFEKWWSLNGIVRSFGRHPVMQNAWDSSYDKLSKSPDLPYYRERFVEMVSPASLNLHGVSQSVFETCLQTSFSPRSREDLPA